MANTITGLVPEMWPPRIQRNLTKSLVALEVCDTTFKADLSYGDELHFPYIGALADTPYVPGQVIAMQDFTAADDTITVEKFKVTPFYVDDVRALQSHQNYAANLADDAAYQLRDAIDTDALSCVSAGLTFGESSYQDYVLDGASSITATATTIDNIFVAARQALRESNVSEDGDWIAVMRPEIAADIELFALGAGFNVADATLRNGYAGDFLGFHCYVSNNITSGHMYLGKRGGISLVIQKEPGMTIKDVDNKLGKNFFPSIVYGTTVFTRNATRFLDVDITS